MLNWIKSAFVKPSEPQSPGPVQAAVVVPPPAPKTYLSKSQIEKIKRFLPDYSWATQTVGSGVPALALAAIHFREAEFATQSKIPGGPFQLDPGGTGQELTKRIWDYTVKVCKTYKVNMADIETNFNVACLVAAHEFKTKIRAPLLNLDGTISEDALADTFFGYNGRSKNYCEKVQTGEGSDAPHWKFSPYVSADPQNGVELKIIGTLPDSTSPTGRKRIETIDKRPGALIVYRELVSRSQELS